MDKLPLQFSLPRNKRLTDKEMKDIGGSKILPNDIKFYDAIPQEPGVKWPSCQWNYYPQFPDKADAIVSEGEYRGGYWIRAC